MTQRIKDSTNEIVPWPDRRIVLVGMMGAGKTSIGRRLAARLGLDFVDADHEIEAAAGCSIGDIFEIYGETAFRDCEKKVIARLLNEGARVIATGGGAFMDDETRQLIKERAISVWLRADVPLLVERVSRRSHRPLLKNGDPETILAALAAKRTPFYEMADIVVDSGEGPHNLVVNAIIAALEETAGTASRESSTE